MRDFAGKVAAITGAGSGIGRGLALELAGRGCHLSLSDVDQATLTETVRWAEKRGPVRVFASTVDVADRDAVESWADTVVSDQGSVHIVVNNAGVALSASVESMSYESFHWLMDINFWGVVHGTKAFLPHLKTSGQGHIVNISSVFGLVGIPTQSAYNASKFAVRGFTEALRLELDLEDCGVSATAVHPGGIKTNIAMNARYEGDDSALERAEAGREFERMARTTPEQAAKVIVRAIQKNKRRATIGGDGVVFDVAARLPPGAYQRAIGRMVRRRADRFG